MEQYESLNHTKWECKYHVVFIPKCRRKTIYGAIKRELGPVFRKLTEHKESRIEEGHLMVDHVHMLLTIPPKYPVANVVADIRRAEAELRRAALLGTGLLRLDRRERRSRHPRVHPQPGERGQAPRPAFVDQVGRHLQVALNRRSRAAPNTAASSGSHIETPRLCRGIC
jgi:REP element-mobilizing transposase RayT